MSLPTLVSRNGKLISPSQASVSVFNPALYGAYGVYESLQVVGRRVFEQGAHIDRLVQSANLLGISMPVSRSGFDAWVGEVLTANHAKDCVLRILVLGAENHEESQAFLWPQPAPVYAQHLYDPGASAITFEGQRALPTCKSLNTLVSSLARRKATALGAHEALLFHDGHVTEGSNSNLFAVVDGEVLTPPAPQVLPGVTRDVLLKLAARHGVPHSETPLPLAGIPCWSECFITSTSRHVMPVSRIDGLSVGSGQPGPITRHLADQFEAYFREATATSS